MSATPKKQAERSAAWNEWCAAVRQWNIVRLGWGEWSVELEESRLRLSAARWRWKSVIQGCQLVEGHGAFTLDGVMYLANGTTREAE